MSPKKKDVSYFENWLKENMPNISIVEWAGPKDISIFRDENRDKIFQYKFCNLRDLFRRNPLAIPSCDTKEKTRGLKNQTQKQKEESRKKAVNTWIEKYGVDNPSKDKQIAEKISKKNSENSSFLDKSRKTMMERYGVISPLQREESKLRQQQTVLEKYGVKNISQLENIKEKKNSTKIKNGNIILVNGKQIKQLAEEKGLSYSKVQSDLKRGIRENLIIFKKTGIEQKMSAFLSEITADFSQGKSINGGYRPDFNLIKNGLVIECDGLYWHSDKIRKDKFYHKKKKEFYNSKNLDSLFFREDEILNKFEIVCSIIKNKLNLNERIFARKCKISCATNSFFEQNHLMGKGAGRIYSLEFQDETVAAIQTKWKNKKNKVLEISRFCTKNGVSVIGGYSKLIKHVEKIEEPKKIITFTDLRYGSGEYLTSLGFKKCSEHLSFAWTDFKKTYHRMAFPGNTGYEKGLFKIWDCGQRLYEK